MAQEAEKREMLPSTMGNFYFGCYNEHLDSY